MPASGKLLQINNLQRYSLSRSVPLVFASPRQRRVSGIGVACLFLLSLSACTSIPKSDLPEARFADLVCADLDGEVAVSQKSISAATDAKTNSWNAWNIPIPSMTLIGVRYANASMELTNAQNRLGKLQGEQKLKNC